MSNVRLRGGLIAESLRFVAASPLTDNKSFAKWSKLEVMQHLLQIGWGARPSGELKSILPPEAGGAREFAIDAASKPLSYLRAMVLAPYIFTKPGNLMFIVHGAIDAYYVALVRSPNLAKLAALTEEEVLALKTKDVKDLAAFQSRRNPFARRRRR